MKFTRRGWTVTAAAAAIVLAVGAGGWIAVAAFGGAPARPRPDLTALVDQFRNDEPRHQVRLTFTNHGPQPVVVNTVQLRSADFAVVPPRRHDYALPPGGTIGVGLPATFGDAICAGGIPTVAKPAQAAAVITYPDGGHAEFVWPLEDKRDLLSLLLRQDCERQKIASAVELGLTGPWTPARTDNGDPSIHATLDLRLTNPDATVEVSQVRGSILYHLRTPPIRLDSAHPQLHVPVVFVNNRCDEHAVSGSTQSYIFRLWLRIDGTEPIPMVIPGVDDTAKEALATLIRTGCGFGER